MEVTIRLCGPLAVEIGGRRVEGDLPSRQGRLAFAYLVLNRARPVTRDELREALWPAPSAASPERRLTELLSRLRRALPDGTLDGREKLSLRLGETPWIDVERAAAALGETPERMTEALAIAEQPLLPGLEADWLEPHRHELAGVAAGLLEALAGAALAGGDRVKAEITARRLVAREPYRESAHALLIECLADRGDLAEALAAYDAVRTRLREDLGTIPGPRLRALAERLLRAEAAPPLPRPATALVGREDDVQAIVERLEDPQTRILTLLGPGGVGKTRLAVEVLHRAHGRFRDGARIAWLDPVALPEHVTATLSRAAGGDGGLIDARMLLLADNFEHVIDAAPQLARLVETCPHVTLLVTTRERLRLRAERIHHVEPLGESAVTLFAQRARELDPGFEPTPAVADLCARVDGLPLAIELAAAWTGTLTPAEIGERLVTLQAHDAHRDVPARQRTLHATIDWSVARLDEAERRAFTALAVFSGGCTLAAAETFATPAVIDALVAKSLIRRRGGRLTMLTTLREYAAPSIPDAVRARHAEWCLALARRESPGLLRFEAAPERALEAELDNLRQALAYGRAHAPALHAELTGHLRRFWWTTGRVEEGLAEVDHALAAGAGRRAPLLHARAALSPLDAPERVSCARAGIAAFEADGDPYGAIECLNALIEAEVQLGRWQSARELAAHSRELAGDDPLWLGRAACAEAYVLASRGGWTESVEEAARHLRAAGSLAEVSLLYSNAAFNALRDGAYAEADALLTEAAELAHAGGASARWLAALRGNQGLAALLRGRLDDAAAAFREEIDHAREGRFRNLLPEGLLGLAAVAARTGDHERAARLAGAADGCLRAGVIGVEEPLLVRVRQQFLAPARESLGDDAWLRAYRAGAALAPREAAAFALGT